MTEATAEVDEHKSGYSGEESDGVPNDVEILCQTVVDITTEQDTVQMQLQQVTEVLEQN